MFLTFLLLFYSIYFLFVFLAWDFKRGEQVFENYGQPNHLYFAYHGFSLPVDDRNVSKNTHDCIQTDFFLTKEERISIDWKADNVRRIAQVSLVLYFCMYLVHKFM